VSSSALIDSAVALAPSVASRSAETETQRCVPPDLVEQLAAAGFFRLYVPSSLGGPQVDPLTAFSIIETLSAADGSTGWTTFILNTTFFTCWLDDDVAGEMLATVPDGGMAGLIGPLGRAVADGSSSFRVAGRWPFNSGCPHASWFCEGVFVTDDHGEICLLDDGRPDWRFVFAPAADVEIVDTWHVAGLRGTASHDVVMNGALVPVERTANPLFAPAAHDAPHFRWSFFALLASLFAGFPLGVARRAIDDFSVVACEKSRGGGPVLADTDTVAIAVVRAEAAVRAARALVVDALGTAWVRAEAGDPLTAVDRVAIRMAVLHAMRTALATVDEMFAMAGGGALYDHDSLQRCWRDVHAGSHHVFFSDAQVGQTGRMLLGRPGEHWMV
jgi:indole-3-acetate monooxygenase